MSLGERLTTLLRTLNPDQYPKLCAQFRLADALRQFLFNFLAIFILMLLLLVPGMLIGAPQIQQRMAAFQESWIDGNFAADQRIMLVQDPKVAVDLSENATLQNEKLLFTSKGIEWKRWYFFGKSSRNWENIQNMRDIPVGVYTALLLFLAPSIAFWFGIFFLIKYAFMALFFGCLGYFIPKLWRHTISFENAIKVSFFSTTVMMLIQMMLFPFFRISWLHTILYVLFLVIGIILVGDRDIRPHRGHKV